MPRPQPSQNSTRENHRRPSSDANATDEDLQEVFQASLQAEAARERTIRRRNEDAAAREAADEAAAIAESATLAATQTDAQRQAAAAADTELERVLRESVAESDRRKAHERAELDRLHASFGSSSDRSQHRASGWSPHSPPISSQRDRAHSPPTSAQRDRANSLPRNSAPSPTNERERPHSTSRNSPAPSQERTRPQVQPVLIPSSSNSRQESSPRVASPGASRPNSLGDLSRQGLEPARRSPGRAAPVQQQHRGHLPDRLREMRMDDPDPPVRRSGNSPVPRPNSIGRRHSERLPNTERRSLQRASSSSSRREARQNTHRGPQDLAIRQAIHNSARYAQLEHGRGGHRRREEEQLRLAMQNSLGDAPPPADPTEGLENPPPGYNEFQKDKKVDPLRFTTTNEKGNEPGYLRRLTPETLEIMKNFLIEQQHFDAKAKASENGQKRAPAAPSSASGSSSRQEPTESLEALLGTRLPAPPSRSRPTPAARADNAFVSRMPGLASDARERIPQSRPWENAFSTIPNTRPHRGRH